MDVDGTKTVLEIVRGVGPDDVRTEAFEVPFGGEASVLDGLLWIREHVDSTLAFRFSCISANVCRECIMLIDGKTAYACVERLNGGRMALHPLATKRHIRDLACATIPPKESLHPGGAPE
jgi:succinate dehydrogenase/fumarate reductase-like Fe-S protein